MSNTLRPRGSFAGSAVSLGTGSESAYVLAATIVVDQPGLILLQGDVGAGLGLGGLKFTRSATEGGSEVKLAEGSGIESATAARGFLDVIGDGSNALYQTGAGASFQVSLLWNTPGVLYVYAKRYDNSAATSLTISAAMGERPASVPQSGAASVPGDLTIGNNKFTVAASSGNTAVGGTLAVTGAATFSSHVTIADAKNLILDTTTGTKIGTSVSQKLGFWNATPVVQQASANQAAVTSLTASSGGASGGNTVPAVTDSASAADAVATLAAKVNGLNVLVTAIRTALVNTGIIKGAA